MRDPRFANAGAWEQYSGATPEQLAEARAIGRATAEGRVDVALLRHARDALPNSSRAVLYAFDDEVVVAACEHAPRHASWTSALEAAFDEARRKLSTSPEAQRHTRELQALSREWQAALDPFSVWSSRDAHDFQDRTDLWQLGRVLLRIAPDAGLRAIDSLPFPGLMKEVLHLASREDRSLIEALIRAAPPVFDDAGRWRQERSVAALLVMHLVTEHAEALHAAVSFPLHTSGNEERTAAARAEVDGVQEHELPNWMRHAFGLVLQRPDGVWMALGYLAKLSRERLLGHAQTRTGNACWRAADAALVALAEQLRHYSVGVARVRDAWTAAEELARAAVNHDTQPRRVRPRSAHGRRTHEGEGARSLHAEGLPLLHGAAVVVGDAVNTSASEVALLWSWFAELLIGRDPGLSLIHQGSSLTDVPQHFGFLLSKLGSPDTLLRALYAKLEPQRRRAMFPRRYEELYPDLESVLLLRVGLNATANWLDRDAQRADDARELFFWIHKAARRLWLTATMDTGNTKRQLVLVCYAFIPFLFGQQLRQALNQTFPPIANDPRMLSDACATLRLNGLEADEVRGLCTDAGGDLVGALRQAHQWSQLTGLVEDFPGDLQELANELGLELEAPEPR